MPGRPARRGPDPEYFAPDWATAVVDDPQPLQPLRMARRVPASNDNPPMENLTVSILQRDDAKYAQALRAAPEFFRRQAEWRYSDTTIMNLSRTWDLFNENQSAPELPIIFIAEVPFSYDEETEVKRGGTVGMLVIFADKSLLAVARTARRRGVANTIWDQADYYGFLNRMAFWIGRQNTVGHVFCLTHGLFPTAMNGQGAVRYSRMETSDE